MKLFWQVLVYGALAGLIIGSASLLRANADPTDTVSQYTVVAADAVCSTLDKYPSVPGVIGVLEGVESDSGFTVQQSAQVVVNAVYARCPRFILLLQEAAAAPPKAVSAV